MGIPRACFLRGRRPRASSISSRSYFVSAPRPLVHLPSSSSSSPSSPSCTITPSSPFPSKRYRSDTSSTSSFASSPSLNPPRPAWSISPRKEEEAKKLESSFRTNSQPKPTPTGIFPSPSPNDADPLITPPPPSSRPTQRTAPFSPPLVPDFLSSSPDTLAPSDISSTSSSYSPPNDDQEDPSSYASSSQPYHYIPTNLFAKDPSYQSLDALLLTPTVHPDLAMSQEALDRSDQIWEVYKTVTNHRLIPAEAWMALLRNVVPPTRVASSMTGKRNEFGSTVGFGSAVLTNYLRRGYEERFHRIMQDKAKAGLEPSGKEFRLIMEHFAPNGYVKGVESVFAAMVLKGLTPGPRDYECRLEAIVYWLRRYQSLEAEALIADGVLHPFEVALASVPDLVGTIMASLNTASFTPTLSRRTVDLACELFAQTGDTKAYNRLARFEYGVDLDVPDAIPEEFLARMQQGEKVWRGLSVTGLQAALKLWEKEGDFYKMLSMFEVFAYPLPMPKGTPAGLDRAPSWRSACAFTVEHKKYAPPLPPTTVVEMMNLRKVPVVASSSSSSRPQSDLATSDLTPSSTLSSNPTTSSSSSSTTPPPSSSRKPATYTFQPVPRPLCFTDATQGNVNSHTFTQLLQGPCSTSGPLNKGDLFLSKHILTRALSEHYTRRQTNIGQLLRIISISSSKDRKERNVARMRLIRKDFDLARVEWFMLFSQCCSRNPGREAFEALRWAEKELNALRGALELDVLVMQKAKDVLEKDDQDVEEERRRGLNGEDPSKSPPPNTLSTRSTWRGPSLDARLQSIFAQLRLYNQVGTRMLGFRLAALAWKDTQVMISLLKQGRPHVFQFPDGTTIGSRLQEYAIVLAERLPAELEPRSSRRHLSSSNELVSIGAGGARGEEDFEALFAEEIRMDERMRAGLDGTLSAGGVGKMSWNWGLHMGGRKEVLEGEDLDPVHPSPFRRHQIKKTSKFGRYPTVEGANEVGAGWATGSGGMGGSGGAVREEERMVQPSGFNGEDGAVAEELPEELKETLEEWEREKGEVERRYGGELEEVGKGVWA